MKKHKKSEVERREEMGRQDRTRQDDILKEDRIQMMGKEQMTLDE